MYVVGRAVLPKKTSAPFANFPPLMMSVKLPTKTVVGEIVVTIGIGFSSVTRAIAESNGSAILVAVTLTGF
jgi:hypothetical protein